jgi:hypothetical protein
VAQADPVVPADVPASASIPAARAPSIPHVLSPVVPEVQVDPAAQVVPADAPASASVPASAVPVPVDSVARVPAALVAPAAHLLRVRLRVHPAVLRPKTVAVAVSSTPRPRKAR